MTVTKLNLGNSQDWSYRGQISKIARKRTEKNRVIYSAIPKFDLGFVLNARFLAISVLLKYGRPNWNHGGFINQVYSLPFSTAGGLANRAETNSQILLVNRTRLIVLPRLSGQSYRLIYTPRRWFRDVKIKLWQYRGEESNFTEDTLVRLEEKINTLM